MPAVVLVLLVWPAVPNYSTDIVWPAVSAVVLVVLVWSDVSTGVVVIQCVHLFLHLSYLYNLVTCVC